VFVSEPLHYLALIETKPNAHDQTAALQGWDLPVVSVNEVEIRGGVGAAIGQAA
jgi:hypothetical protein